MIANDDQLISHVAAHAGVSLELARRVLGEVLPGIGAYLSPPARQLIAGELPRGAAAALLADDGMARPLVERLLAPGITAGRARELLASVGRVLVEELSAEAARELRRCAPPELAAFLAPPAREEPPHAAPSARRETLAAGRPGSHHPLAEAPPRGAQPDSVAAENPHAAAKLSSATAAPPERSRDTLASGNPGSDHPVTGARPSAGRS